jgi:hypothetical protein
MRQGLSTAHPQRILGFEGLMLAKQYLPRRKQRPYLKFTCRVPGLLIKRGDAAVFFSHSIE